MAAPGLFPAGGVCVWGPGQEPLLGAGVLSSAAGLPEEPELAGATAVNGVDFFFFLSEIQIIVTQR